MSAIFSESNEPLVNVVQQFVRLLNVKITASSVNETVLSHPDYPSLLSISDCFTQWKIDNAAVKIDGSRLAEIPTPFIGYIGGELKVVTQSDSDRIHYIEPDGESKSEDKISFLDRWHGVAFLAETNENSGQPNYTSERFIEQKKALAIPFIILLMAAWAIPAGYIFSLDHTTQDTFVYSGLILSKVLGISVCMMLLWYEVDKYNTTLKKLCSGVGAKTDCNAVLNSSQSKVFSWLSWSELGFIYFAGGFLTLALYPNLTFTIGALSLLALPYIIFSVTYQAFVIKQWCPFCLAIQVILLTEFLLNGINGFRFIADIQALQAATWSFLSLSILQLAIVYLIPSLALFSIKPLIIKTLKGNKSRFELNRLKANSDIFASMLSSQKRVVQWESNLGITLGNDQAQNTVIKVCNPYCDPCSNAHPEIKKLLNESQNVKVQIIYNTSYSGYDKGVEPVRHFLAIHESNSQDHTKKALDDWYLNKNKNYKTYALNHPVDADLLAQDAKIKKMHDWTVLNDVAFTPTYFFNGVQLPAQYGLSDLKYFLL